MEHINPASKGSRPRPWRFDSRRVDRRPRRRWRSHEQKEFGGLTENRTRVHGFAGLSGLRPFNDLAAKWADFRPNEIKGLRAGCKLSDGRFWCWSGACARGQASPTAPVGPKTRVRSELAGGLAPASEKPRQSFEAPAVGPISVEACVARRGAVHPETDVQGFVTATHSRAARPGLARDEGAPPWPPQTELASGLAPASKKPHPLHEAPAVGPITIRSLRGAAGVIARDSVQGFVTAPIPRALRPGLVRALAACLRGAARPQIAASIPYMEPTR
jgi:hypothetical protein